MNPKIKRFYRRVPKSTPEGPQRALETKMVPKYVQNDSKMTSKSFKNGSANTRTHAHTHERTHTHTHTTKTHRHTGTHTPRIIRNNLDRDAHFRNSQLFPVRAVQVPERAFGE